MQKDLKPCPFCKGTIKISLISYDLSDVYKPCCKTENCPSAYDTTYNGTLDGEYDTEAEAIAAWNTRPIEDALRQRVKELEARLFKARFVIRGQMNWKKEARKQLKGKDKRIKSQEATIDALLAQNQTQMEELEKHEAWQKDSVKYFKEIIEGHKQDQDIRDTITYTDIDWMTELIKQAEAPQGDEDKRNKCKR